MFDMLIVRGGGIVLRYDSTGKTVRPISSKTNRYFVLYSTLPVNVFFFLSYKVNFTSEGLYLVGWLCVAVSLNRGS